MNRIRLRSLCIVLGILLIPNVVFAAAFGMHDQGAKAVAMGNAFVAQADDPTALYYNPAGLVQSEGTQVTVGVTAIWPRTEFASATKTPGLGTHFGKVTNINKDEFFVPHFFLTHQYNKKVTLGIGTFSNFGLVSDWPDYWEGRYVPGGNYAQIKTQAINPVIAYKPFDFMSISAGYTAQYMDAELRNRVQMPPGFGPDGWYKLEGDDWAHSWNVGLMFYVPNNVRIGAAYRSQICHDIVGTQEITGNPLINMKSGGTLGINLPDIFQIGVSWSPKPFTIEFDYQWTGWSKYNTLQINVDSTGMVNEMKKDWDDGSAFRLGGSYTIVKNLDLRAGVSYEPELIPDRTVDFNVPAGDRWIWSCGFGGLYGKWVADFSYSYLYDADRSFNNDLGDYIYYNPAPQQGRLVGEIQDSHAHILGLTVTRKF